MPLRLSVFIQISGPPGHSELPRDRGSDPSRALNDPTRLRDIGHFMTRGGCDKPAALHIRRGAQTLDVTAARVSMDKIDGKIFGIQDLAGETFQRLSKDVAYLVDIRNYSSEFVVFALGQLLVDKPGELACFIQGDLANPGACFWGTPLSLQTRQPHFKGKVVILVDEVSQSQAEYTTMAFRSAEGAVVLGSTTAGADGNVSSIALPGGLRTMISGIGVFNPDRKPTQRIGIVPDLEVKPTIAGIRGGRDELLEAAIRLIEK